MKKTVMILFLLWYILGCAYTRTVKTSGMDFAPTKEINLLVSIPSQPHKQIGTVEAVVCSSYGAALEDMKKKGMAMGADALVLLDRDMTAGGLRITALAIKYQDTPSQNANK
jgi:hypothetical protein